MDNCMKGFLLFKNDQWVLSCFIKSFSWLTQDLANFQGAQSMHIFVHPNSSNSSLTAMHLPQRIWLQNWDRYGPQIGLCWDLTFHTSAVEMDGGTSH